MVVLPRVAVSARPGASLRLMASPVPKERQFGAICTQCRDKSSIARRQESPAGPARTPLLGTKRFLATDGAPMLLNGC